MSEQVCRICGGLLEPYGPGLCDCEQPETIMLTYGDITMDRMPDGSEKWEHREGHRSADGEWVGDPPFDRSDTDSGSSIS